MNHTLLLPPHRQPPTHFTLRQDQIQIHGYQLYAVEKWIVERKTVTLLVVYTGDPAHKASLSALAPSPSLSPADARAAWNAAITQLRADGAKPKQTPHGVLMVTSLAHFRSDYTIVQIPDGNFLAVKDQLYANINLLRVGCSGRTALTLEDPSDTTKERFISTYHLPEATICPPLPTSLESLPLTQSQSHIPKPNPHIGLGRPSINVIAATPSNSWRSPERQPNHSTSSLVSRKEKERLQHGKTKERSTFVTTVLELVKLIQAGLAIFGMYGPKDTPSSVSPNLVLDGLLCDDTVDGIRNWIATIGGPCVGLEPTERIADPMFVSALLSLVLATRNKMALLGLSHLLPRDPFLYPHAFSQALTAYIQNTSPLANASTNVLAAPHHHTVTPPHLSIPHLSPLIPPAPPPTNILSASAAAAAALATGTPTTPIGSILTRELVESISAMYDAKSEHRKGRRAIKNKLAPTSAGSVGGLDSDGADGDRERDRRNTLSLSLSHSGGEGGSVTDRSPSLGHTQVQGGPSGAGVGPSIGSSGGQILSGIGSLASGLGLVGGGGLGPGGGSGTHGDAGLLASPTIDLAQFIAVVVGGDDGHISRRDKKRRKKRERRRESVDIGIGYAYTYGKEREKERDAIVGGSVKALWSGRVADVVRMREWDAEGAGDGFAREKWKRERLGLPQGLASDGDGDESWREGHGKERRYDGRSTEDESDVLNPGGGAGVGRQSFGGIWGGRVRGKLGSWAGGLGRRKHQSVDISGTSSMHSSLKMPAKETSPQTLDIPRAGNTNANTPGGSKIRRPASTGSGPQSPTLPPMVFSADGDRYQDDDDLLSSGQASPLSDYRPTPFNLGSPSSGAGSMTNLDEHALTKLLAQKRPWRRISMAPRISSWADPISARDVGEEDGDDGEGGGGGGVPRNRSREKEQEGLDYEGEESDVSEMRGSIGVGWKRREKARFHSLLSVVDGEGVLVEEPMVSSEDEEEEDLRDEQQRKRVLGFDPRRRRSFHDLDTFRDIEVLSPDRMRMDVDLCGQLLIMWRREEHLRNVIACVSIIANSLSQTNTALREHYDSHLQALVDIDVRSRILAEIDEENATCEQISQATNMLRYESEQFRVPDLWQAVSPSRHKVFELREKIFGTGGRRLPAGVHGAHGPFNRLQWTLDGHKRLVDYLGRTESEAEEERKVDPHGLFIGGPPETEEEDVVVHPGIKPMWLLRFFTSWGASAPTPASGKEEEGKALSPSPPATLAESQPPSPDPANEKRTPINDALEIVPPASNN